MTLSSGTLCPHNLDRIPNCRISAQGAKDGPLKNLHVSRRLIILGGCANSFLS